MGRKRDKQRGDWTFRRYLLRVFIPVAAVALVAVGMRIYLFGAFSERHVSVDEQYDERVAPKDGPSRKEENLPFSESDKVQALAGIRESMELLDESLADISESRKSEVNEALSTAQKQRDDLARSIEKLDAAKEGEWLAARKEAYSKLEIYSDLVGKIVKPQS